MEELFRKSTIIGVTQSIVLLCSVLSSQMDHTEQTTQKLIDLHSLIIIRLSSRAY